ncbi:hypothetical protein D3C71_1730170 [compost metagenome]
MISEIKSSKIDEWEDVHKYYHDLSKSYLESKRSHAFASLLEITGETWETITIETLKSWLHEAILHRTWMVNEIYSSRAKDYVNPFRNMVYNSDEERDIVVGKLEENNFILQQREELIVFQNRVQNLIISMLV